MEKENKYSSHIFWSNTDNLFISIIPEFPGLNAYGETYEEVSQETQNVIREAVSIFEEKGRPLPEPDTLPEHSGQFRIRIPKTLHTFLVLEASRQGISLNTYIVDLLAQGNAANKAVQELREEIKDLLAQGKAANEAVQELRGEVKDLSEQVKSSISDMLPKHNTLKKTDSKSEKREVDFLEVPFTQQPSTKKGYHFWGSIANTDQHLIA